MNGAVLNTLSKEHRSGANKGHEKILDGYKDDSVVWDKHWSVSPVYPISFYAKEVIPPPQVVEDGLIYSLFAQVFVTDKSYFMGSNIFRGRLGAISRTTSQPLTYNVHLDSSLCPDGHDEQTFEWNLYWKPRRLGWVEFSHPESNKELPYTTITTTIEIKELKNEVIKVPFFFKKNVENNVVLIDVDLPIARMRYLD